jgi:thiol-disulfide isomerase/thioredoxin
MFSRLLRSSATIMKLFEKVGDGKLIFFFYAFWIIYCIFLCVFIVVFTAFAELKKKKINTIERDNVVFVFIHNNIEII